MAHSPAGTPVLPSPSRVAAMATALLALTGAAHAHLSIIRQGYESAEISESSDQHGFAVAAGDFNGDGYDDLAMGAPQEDGPAGANSGVVCVNWGSEYGITHEGAIVYDADDMGGAASAGANLGFALASEDLDGDGFDDLIVGAPFETVNGAAGAGAVYVMTGSTLGLVPWLRIDQSDLGGTAETGDWFGFSLDTGYLDDDAYPDLLMGAPGEDTARGTVWFLFGTSTGPYGSANHINPTYGGYSTGSGDFYGYSVAAGNFMGGAEDDIIVGAPHFPQASAPSDLGAVFVTPGSAGGPDRAATRRYFANGGQAGAEFGRSVAVGHLLSSAYDAVAVGEPLHDKGGIVDAGRVTVYPGWSGGLNTDAALPLYSSVAGGVDEASDGFGQVLAVDYFWDASDGYQDLVIGTPGEGFGTPDAYGQVQILNGGPSGPIGAYGWFGFNQGTLNETPEPLDVLGASIAFGRFDGTDLVNLAVGAPGEDAFGGMVHVIAPWRQVFNLSCDNSIVLDCDENIYFSQKPFERVRIASTTKIMTVLIAVQAVEWYDELSYDDVYTVPAWVADQIPGSQVPLFEGETITLRDLMYTCLMLSGNDAAFAIADMIQGGEGPDVSVPLFVARMNAIASILNMDDTHFHNPAGLDEEPVGPDLGEHYSTPQDMAKLSAYAMTFDTFHTIAGTTAWPMVRHFPAFDIAWTVNNIFAGVLMNNIEPLVGIKGGYTTLAQNTGCFAGETPLGARSIAGTYHTPDALSDNYGPDAGALVQLGLGSCGFSFELPDEWSYTDSPINIGRVSSGVGSRRGFSSGIPREFHGDMAYSVYRTSWDTGLPSSFEAWITHVAELRGRASYELGASHHDGHGPIKITNVGDATASVQVWQPIDVTTVDLEPGETALVPEYLGRWALGFPVRFTSNGGESPIDLDVEIPWRHLVTAPEAPTSDPVYQTTLMRESDIRDQVEIRTEGMDPAPDFHSIVGHVEGVLLEAPDPAGTEPPAAITLRAPTPNPFRAAARISFDLSRAGEVGVEIYDVSGRLVRTFAPQRMAPGGWGLRWDGRDDGGAEAASGAYFYHVVVDGEVAATGKLTRIVDAAG